MPTTPNLNLPVPGGTVTDTRLGDIAAVRNAITQLDGIVKIVQDDVAAKSSQGAAGPTGPAGPIGIQGPIGPVGPTGAAGLDGLVGMQGPQGPTGATGTAGAAGLNGPIGPQGPQGATGPMGLQGPAGTNGFIGSNGATGATGPTGPAGTNGINGTNGIDGVAGAVGAMGPAGPTIKELPQVSRSANYTCVLSDNGNHIFHPSADTTARTFTIPSNASVAYPLGTTITFVNQNGAGVITISINVDTMRLAGVGTTGPRVLAANGIATAIKVTATEWLISGTALS